MKDGISRVFDARGDFKFELQKREIAEYVALNDERKAPILGYGARSSSPRSKSGSATSSECAKISPYLTLR